jgi:hypothetical protein
LLLHAAGLAYMLVLSLRDWQSPGSERMFHHWICVYAAAVQSSGHVATIAACWVLI